MRDAIQNIRVGLVPFMESINKNKIKAHRWVKLGKEFIRGLACEAAALRQEMGVEFRDGIHPPLERKIDGFESCAVRDTDFKVRGAVRQTRG